MEGELLLHSEENDSSPPANQPSPAQSIPDKHRCPISRTQLELDGLGEDDDRVCVRIAVDYPSPRRRPLLSKRSPYNLICLHLGHPLLTTSAQRSPGQDIQGLRALVALNPSVEIDPRWRISYTRPSTQLNRNSPSLGSTPSISSPPMD